jgi:hypothetical protein
MKESNNPDIICLLYMFFLGKHKCRNVPIQQRRSHGCKLVADAIASGSFGSIRWILSPSPFGALHQSQNSNQQFDGRSCGSFVLGD